MEQYSFSHKQIQMTADILKNGSYRTRLFCISKCFVVAISTLLNMQASLPRESTWGRGESKIVNLAAVTVQWKLHLLFVCVRHIKKQKFNHITVFILMLLSSLKMPPSHYPCSLTCMIITLDEDSL